MWSLIATLCALLLAVGSGLLLAALVLWLVLYLLGIDAAISWRVLASWIGGLLSLYAMMRSAITRHGRT